MTREELKQQFLELGKPYELGDNSFEQFYKQLVFPTSCIKNIMELEDYDKDSLKTYFRIWIDTTKSSMTYYFDIVCAEKVNFNEIILKAIQSYNDWCCEPQYEEYGILRTEEVVDLYLINGDGVECDIFKTLEGMKETIISRMEESSQTWTSENVKMFEYYAKTLMPILEAIDYVNKHTDAMKMLG